MQRSSTDITPEVIQQHGLSDEEYQQILKHLGREPNLTELGVFSVMWSEHCSYKSSRIHLKRFPTEGERVIQGPGENAGAVDIGDGLCAVFKMESHNHPSFIEPFQGAATGVGGILRDIFTMGARPIALLDSLRFGELDQAKNRHLLKGVISGISWYGNCIGVPTVGGEIVFNDIYGKNPLVNVFCLGIVKTDQLLRGAAEGVGNPVLYIGAKTGRDGIHGATMASDSFDDASEKKRPNVQVGDPFLEKLLLEACLEFLDKDILAGIQDMGAAGLTSSSCEMASRAGTGIELELANVPRREPNITPYELMLSESQERMLLVAKAGKEDQVLAICKKWGIDAAVVGKVTDDGFVRLKEHGTVVAEIPAKALADESPKYERPIKPPEYQDVLQSYSFDNLPDVKDPETVLRSLLESPTIASKSWVYRQYDHMVGINTIVRPGSDAAVVRIKGTNKALAMTTDGNSRYCLLNPYMGGTLAIAEAARNLVCSGAQPIGVTDCLNFGNPERPDIMWQFVLAVEGISDACRAFHIPVVSGNVSLYNETNGLSIYPTPVIGMVGLIEPAEHATTQWFKNPGDRVIVLGETKEDLGGTEYLKIVHYREQGSPPWLNLETEKALHDCLLAMIHQGWVQSAHDCSDGGLAVTLAECCFSPQVVDGKALGGKIQLESDGQRLDALLFGESPSRVVLSISPEHSKQVLSFCQEREVPAMDVGEVGGVDLDIAVTGGRSTPGCSLHLPVTDLFDLWNSSLEHKLHD
ncbi:phosphoribosylformylglycinamidine synthase subunit PurL [Candidatus Nitronereus thalassa]|uniref:Phosphoribosylformylglycinamidine synthase subunit PurL n=1 Tax=Candidatus Nitronereus thalassa TaxID=3020898 RepID=A0ABU3K451_9BACT|nr:phosphoribosylformylglycinamidine synthase subunit PurL [Candidatus Nitronereus thalassa]MDT7041156.1 phosphoribosylformylglycinamidine synthase subunit PurL [Candidatus Nitronereus thalassa]